MPGAIRFSMVVVLIRRYILTDRVAHTLVHDPACHFQDSRLIVQWLYRWSRSALLFGARRRGRFSG